MKIQQINYDKNEKIECVTVMLTFNEAVAIVNIAGKLNGYATERLKLTEKDSLYDTLCNMFNQHYEDGCPDLHIELDTLKDAKS